jgi:hypothetical protein
MLVRLSALPRWLVPIMLGAFLLAGFAVDGLIGGLLLLIVGLFLGWLLMLSWPLLGPGSKVIRVLVVGTLIGVAIVEATSGS